MDRHKHREFLLGMFRAAVEAATPERVIPRFLPDRPKGRTVVVGAGKASAAMARALEQHWDGPLTGLVVTRYGHAVPCKKIEIVEAAHPLPDSSSLHSAERMLSLVKGLTKDDLVIALFSGGGSSLLALPADGISFNEKRAINRFLLQSGIPISQMNCLRKHISAIKGGRLAVAAYPARIVNLVISDVPEDDASAIASGPTLPDPTTNEQALEVAHRHGFVLPDTVRKHLKRKDTETPMPNDVRFADTETKIVASPQLSLEAAAAFAVKQGVAPLILGDSIEAESRELGFAMAGIARQAQKFAQPAVPPCVLISGGETTVTVRGDGSGGRNVEFLLAMALKLNAAQGIHALAADTDGVDGSREIAGAMIFPDTLARARTIGIDAWGALKNNDAHRFFEVLGDQVITGPTLTNVNDFRVALIS